MKKVLSSLLCLLMFYFSFSQSTDTTRFVDVTAAPGYKWKGGKFLQALIHPNDTTFNKTTGSTAYLNGVFYIKSSTKWDAFGQSISSITAGIYLTGGTITSSGTIGVGDALSALAAYSATGSIGIISKTGANTFANRTITTSYPLSVTNEDGVLGNPLIQLNAGVLDTLRTKFLYINDTASMLDSYLRKTGGAVSGPITYSGIPVLAEELVNKNYIDNALTGITWKNAVKAKTTGNHSLSGTSNVDGTTILSGTRVLVALQTDAKQNGIYISAAGAWIRALDCDDAIEIETSTVLVTNGTVNKNTQWTCTATDIILGVSNITYGQISGAGTYTNGSGLSLTANVFSIMPLGITNSMVNDVGWSKVTNFSGSISQLIRGDGTLGTIPTSLPTTSNLQNITDNGNNTTTGIFSSFYKTTLNSLHVTDSKLKYDGDGSDTVQIIGGASGYAMLKMFPNDNTFLGGVGMTIEGSQINITSSAGTYLNGLSLFGNGPYILKNGGFSNYIRFVPLATVNRQTDISFADENASDTVAYKDWVRSSISSLVTGVSSFNGRSGAVVSGSSDYTTTQVAEGGNMYWTNARGDARYFQIANNLSEGVAATIRTNIGGTTLGQSIFTAPNPSAIRYIKIGADNLVSLRTASNMLSDLSGAPLASPTFTGTVTLPSASATLDFGSTAAQNSSELTITVTGAADGDMVILGVPNASSNANSCYTVRVSATNTVSVRFNNYSSGAINPASGTFKVSVIK